MTVAKSKTEAAAELRALIDDRAEAVRAKEIDGAMANVASDVVSFDIVNPLRYCGADAGRDRLEEWFASFQGPIDYELRDLSIAAGDDVAFCHSLNRVSGTKLDGEKIVMWWRATVCYRKLDGTWLVAHEQSSVPFDVESGKASLDLTP